MDFLQPHPTPLPPQWLKSAKHDQQKFFVDSPFNIWKILMIEMVFNMVMVYYM